MDPIEAACRAAFPLWGSASPETHEIETQRMIRAIEAYEEALEISRRCDEPGCTAEATCGFPTNEGGYRRTCGKHVSPGAFVSTYSR